MIIHISNVSQNKSADINLKLTLETVSILTFHKLILYKIKSKV